ncbi:hypothetical protein [Acinetobacter baumannii]|uniref:hypothetical protein n=1 Tax=Acinetobacter baumannii TaxID=470 RepID=UPI00313F221E
MRKLKSNFERFYFWLKAYKSWSFYKTWIFWASFYGVVIFLYNLAFIFIDPEKKVLLTSNELGDFLAGVFAPLAFLFLYLGYRQQGEEMKQNTAALKLQAQELKHSVDEQRRLIQLHEKEQEEKHFQVLPDFRKTKENVKKYQIQSPIVDEDEKIIGTEVEKYLRASFTFVNYGEVAKNVLVKSFEDEFYVRQSMYKINYEEPLDISFELNEQIMENLGVGAEYYNTLILTFTNLYGKAYTKYIHYTLSGSYEPEFNDVFFSLSVFIKD